MPELPPGPGAPPFIQMMHWVWRPIPFMEECARRYGDCFTVRFPLFGSPGDRPPLVFFSDPDAVREIFTGDPEILRAGESNAILEPGSLPTGITFAGAERLQRYGAGGAFTLTQLQPDLVQSCYFITNSAAIVSIASHRFCNRIFSFALC